MLLEARGITKVFGAFKAVDSASVAVNAGEILGLIGPNGAGKSTFFNCLTGDLSPTSGTVLLQGEDVTSRSPERRAELGLARSFQLPQTFGNMSIVENVMIGAGAHSRKGTAGRLGRGRRQIHRGVRPLGRLQGWRRARACTACAHGQQ